MIECASVHAAASTRTGERTRVEPSNWALQAPATRDAAVLKQLRFASDVHVTRTAAALSNLEFQLDDTTRGRVSVAGLRRDCRPAASIWMWIASTSTATCRLPNIWRKWARPALLPSPTPIPDPSSSLTQRGVAHIRVGEARFSGLQLSRLTVARSTQPRQPMVQTHPPRSLYGAFVPRRYRTQCSGCNSRASRMATQVTT